MGELPAPGYLSVIPEMLQLIFVILHESCGILEVWQIGHPQHLCLSGVG